MKITPISNDRTEHNNAHNMNNDDTTEIRHTDTRADNITPTTAIKPSMHDWTPPLNYPPSTVARHHQHNDIKITDQPATSLKQPTHMRNQLPANITLTKIAPSDMVEKIEERGMHMQSGKNIATHTVKDTLDIAMNIHNVHSRSKNRQRSITPCSTETERPATK